MHFARMFAATLFAACLVFTGAASAQDYPNRPITMLVPFPPGGATDTIARILQDPMQKALGQPIVIENIGGAGGMICAAKAARARRRTVTPSSSIRWRWPQACPLSGFDLRCGEGFCHRRADQYRGLDADWPRDLPPNNFTELLAWMKQPGQTVKIGHAGVGSYAHLAGVLVAQELGIKATQVPYRGAGPALVDLLAGQVDLESQTAIVAAQLVKAGKLKAYAVIGRKRFAGMPDLPTMGELGYKKLDIDFWHMLLVPAGTPRPIIDKINAALRTALADPKVQKSFADGGMDEFPATQETPEDAAKLLANEIVLWRGVIQANHIAAAAQ